MPIYEYKCEACSQRFERSRPIAERDSAIACAHCGNKRTKRVVIQQFAFARGASPRAEEGEGEAEDFLGGGEDDDFGGGFGGDDDWDDDF